MAQVRTKKKEFLAQIERIVPWKEWLTLIQPCYYKGERGNKPVSYTHLDHVHVFLFSVQIVWQLDAQDDTGKVLDERDRVIVSC